MYLMQTVSTTPRARPLQPTEQSSSMDRSGEVPTLQQVRTSGGEDWSDGGRSPLSSGPGFLFPPPGRGRDKEGADKKKKWSLGGLFRRRKKDIGSESSSQEEDDDTPKKGFLARRRSRREKRKPRTNKSVGTFDHVVINPLTQTLKPAVRSDTASTVEEMNGCGRDANGNTLLVKSKDFQPGEDIVVRHQGGSVDRLSSRTTRESYQRHTRQDSSLSRNSSGGSGSLDQSTGTRRGRRAVKARAEALRDLHKADSSSDEKEVLTNSPISRFKSDDTLSVSLQRDGSISRRSRIARTERYIKRLSRDEEGILKREAAEIEFQKQQRMCKSDAEGSFNTSLSRNRTVPSSNRWTTSSGHQESSDIEHPRMYIRGSSATPSPGHSPLVRHKNLVHYTNSVPLACPPVVFDGTTATFPPPSHTMHFATPVTTNSLDRNTPQLNVRPHGPSPLIPSNRSTDCIPTVGIPRARINDYRQNKPKYECGIAGRSERDYIEFQQPGQRSLSYDNNIHCVIQNYNGSSPVPEGNDVMVVQFPVARLPPSIQQSRIGNMGTGFVALKQGPPPPPPPRDPQRRLVCPGQQDRPLSSAYENSQLHKHEFQQQQPDINSTGIPQIRQHPIMDVDSPWTNSNQRRSNSDNQLAAHRFLNQTHAPHPHAFNPIARPRPSSVTPEAMKPILHQQQYGGNPSKYVMRTTPSPDTYSSSSKQSGSSGQQQQQLHYFADQQPRSRRPIHVQYNTTTLSSDQPYLSDSQVVLMKPPHQHQERRNLLQHATDFWRQKEQEGSLKQKKPIPTSPRLQIRHINRNERSRSNSPRPKELPTGLTSSSEGSLRVSKTGKIKVPPLSIPSVRPADSLSSLSGNSDISSPMQVNTSSKFSPDVSMPENYDSSIGGDSFRKKDNSYRPLSMVLEKSEPSEQVQKPEKSEVLQSESAVKREPDKHEKIQASAVLSSKTEPPTPPARRFSRQSSTSSLEAGDWMSEDVTSEEGRKKKRRSSNLEDALTELEAIYKSLKLGDEDLLDRAERRDLPTAHQQLSESTSEMTPSWSTSRGHESDSGYNYSFGSSSFESLFDGGEPPPRRRAPSLRRSGIPDKVMDDMAYRRLNPKEKSGSQDIRNVVSQSGSYLESSPAAAAAEISADELPQKPLYGPTSIEPDVTLDDVVFRNIRHANNTLKVLDPQPPFGIPLGPIAPAPNSDYLHAVPGDTYRSMFMPRKIPDVVKDDLAYRNLRKDDKDPSFNLPVVTDDMSVLLTSAMVPITHPKNDNFSMRKRRAVRSLSANIQSLVSREPLSLVSRDIDQDFEKAQSLSDLPDALQVAQKILEGKEVIGGGSIKLRNLATGSPNKHEKESEVRSQESARRFSSSPGPSWVERANLTDIGDRSSFLASTSTETLTDSRANLLQSDPLSNKRASWQKKLRVHIPSNTGADSDDLDAIDGNILQRPPAVPTPDRVSNRQLTDQAKSDSYQKPPPTPERSSSRRPSLDQSKIIATFGHLSHPLTPDRDSPRQVGHVNRPTPPLTPGGGETSPLPKANEKLFDRRSNRNSREFKFGKTSPLTDDSLPLPEVVPGSPLDEQQLEDLLSALAREARATSEKLERELEELEDAESSRITQEMQTENKKEEPRGLDKLESRGSAEKSLAQEIKESIKHNLETGSSSMEASKVQEKIAESHSDAADSLSINHEEHVTKKKEESMKCNQDVQYEKQVSALVQSGTENTVKGKLPTGSSEPRFSVTHENTVENEKLSESFEKQIQDLLADDNLDFTIEGELPFIDSDRKSLSKSPRTESTSGASDEIPSTNSDENKYMDTEDRDVNCTNKSEVDNPVNVVPGNKSEESDIVNASQEGTQDVQNRVYEGSKDLQMCVDETLNVQMLVEEGSKEVQTGVDESLKDVAAGGVNVCSNDSVVNEEDEGAASCSSASSSAAAGWYCFPSLSDPASVLVACSYCIACAHQVIGLDLFTVLGIVLAIISLIAALIL